MKKIATITMTLGLGLLLAAGAWAYGGGMMYGSGYGGGMMNGYGGPGWHMGYGGWGAPAAATQNDGSGQAWNNAYCPGWGYGQRGDYNGAPQGSGSTAPNSQTNPAN